MDAGVNILCYKSKTLANGAHPLMIRVCKDGKKKYVSLGVSVLPQFWDFTKNQPKKNCPNKAYIEKIIADKTSTIAKDREFKCTFNLKSQKFDSKDSYYLVIIDEEDKQVPIREEVHIDIAMAIDEFDFFG